MCSVSVYDPRLYLHLDLLIERRYTDNPPRHLCLPVVYFLLFKVGEGKGTGEARRSANIVIANSRNNHNIHNKNCLQNHNLRRSVNTFW
jgi:hypothetical protein